MKDIKTTPPADLVDLLLKEAKRNAKMQGDKEHQTNQRRKTFRFRNHLFTKAANEITRLNEQVEQVRKAPMRSSRNFREGHISPQLQTFFRTPTVCRLFSKILC